MSKKLINKVLFLFIISLLFNCAKASAKKNIAKICENVNISEYKTSFNSVNDFFSFINNKREDIINNDKERENVYNFLVKNNYGKDEEFANIRFKTGLKKYLKIYFIFPILLILILLNIETFLIKPIHSYKKIILSKIPTIVFLLTLILFISILILSVLTLIKTKDYENFLNGSSCLLLKFFQEIIYGKSRKVSQWRGLSKLNSALLETNDFISSMSEHINETFVYLDDINNDINEYSLQINNLYQIGSSSSLVNPNYENKDTIIPIYLYQFRENENKLLEGGGLANNLKKEYIEKFNKSYEIFKDLYDYSIDLSNKNDFYLGNINNVINKISEYNEYINNKTENITQNIIFLTLKSEKFILFLRIISLVLISLFFLLFISLFVYFFLHSNSLKIILHIGWNISLLLILFCTFLFSFLFEHKTYSRYLIYLINDDVLNVNKNIFLNTCLNLNGDLGEVLEINEKNSGLNDLDKYYQIISNQLNQLNLLQETNETEVAIQEIEKYLNNYDLTTDKTYYESDISYILNTLSEITGNPVNPENEYGCSTMDIWVSTKKNCDEKYSYITKSEIMEINAHSNIDYEENNEENNEKQVQRYCLLIQDNYDDEDLLLWYGSRCSKKAYNNIINIISNLNQYYKENEDLLLSIENILKKMKRKNKELISIINYQIRDIKSQTEKFISTYSTLIGQVDIGEMFKCGDLRYELLSFYVLSYNSLFSCSKYLANCLLYISLIGIIAIFFEKYSISFNSYEAYRLLIKVKNLEIEGKGIELNDLPEEYQTENEDED